MPYLDISKNQFNKMISEFISEELSTEELHKLVIKIIKEYNKFDNHCFYDIKILVDKLSLNDDKDSLND